MNEQIKPKNKKPSHFLKFKYITLLTHPKKKDTIIHHVIQGDHLLETETHFFDKSKPNRFITST
jgi:hypothetical protein